MEVVQNHLSDVSRFVNSSLISRHNVVMNIYRCCCCGMYRIVTAKTKAFWLSSNRTSSLCATWAHKWVFWAFLRVFAKLLKATVSFVISVCPSVRRRGATRLQLEEFSWNFIFEWLSKICFENSSFMKICEKWRIVYTNTSVHLRKHLAWIFLEWVTF